MVHRSVNRIWIADQNSVHNFLCFIKKSLKVRVFCVLTSNYTCQCRISSPTTWWYSHLWCQPFSMHSPLWNIALREHFHLRIRNESTLKFFFHGKICHKSLKIGTQHRHSPLLQSSKKNGIQKKFWASKYMLKLVFVQHWKKPSKMKMPTERTNIF